MGRRARKRFERELHRIITDMARQLMRREVIPARLVSTVVRETMMLARHSHAGPYFLRNPRSNRARTRYAHFMLWVVDRQLSAPPAAEPEQSAGPERSHAEIEALLRSARIGGQPAWIFPDDEQVQALRREEERQLANEQDNLRKRYGDFGPWQRRAGDD